ncbi:dihydroorotate dehydrogenase [Diplodia corticola]|uniref:Dihydroorotate dehydrogenase n=1 Tax=Diplodia corticola TaxID=236234 RepID=A0A1J9R5T4_9PEZI|nr:dihydroorotate dehydrogenase [Diplodia corticola]OJD36878.1 dihydroorotate dehydrogenase [Diplodia corticola]
MPSTNDHQDHPPTAFKILTAAQWAAWQRAGAFSGAGIDLADGYIHLSTAATAGETYARYFADQHDPDSLVVVEVDLRRLGQQGTGAGTGAEVKWEVSRGGALFPHVYGEIPVGAVGRRWEGGEVGRGLFEGLEAEAGRG